MMSYSGICESFLIFKNGKEAYDHLSIIIKENKSLPDIILLDINMPIMNGWQFLDEIIKINIPKELKIFIVSSSENPEDIEKSKEYNFIKDYVVKPINATKLKQIMAFI
ncbi:response regulator [Mesonia oceanica]|nr:response regulator [Mesonia oceanica]